ncbi:MAG: polyprenyl synthetase family protein [Rikenellaceae bacterium]|jgi:octaprenyl-diphosphate synthase|nr:polyprenyl synthetase family protein [Rikenellaceae bacterium]
MKEGGNILKTIQKPVEAEMRRFNELLTENYRSQSLFVSTITDYVLEQRGKQMRPLLVLLSAALNGGIGEKSYIGAILVEMTHTASLVHDDIIDEAYMRRGQLSTNAIWRSRTAVLVGDYILAHALSITAENNAYELMRPLIDSFEKLCEGELIQLEHASKLDMTEAAYFNVIHRKTASLLGACGAIGASSAGASAEVIAQMQRFGECIGMAFQIKDDLLDYRPASQTGKAAGNDLKERKITLPLLYLLNHSSASERKKLIRTISTIRDREENIAWVQQQVAASGAIAYTEQVMQNYEQQALEILASYPPSPIRDSLEAYCHFILQRKK